ncbi:MAG: MotA/TolQ/ExbB proton channel family protein [Ignavibacteria bacterium]|jgi:biopolymer transport protein ExbB|nr:MotA/TolQ/ExbB proton channel family protein [Ignavibacteria bacterium]
MKRFTNVIIIILALIVAVLFFNLVLGAPGNFNDVDKAEPINALGMVHTGGPLVALLISFIIIAVVYFIERFLSINKAKGKNDPVQFIRKTLGELEKGNLEVALKECDNQRGSVANVLRAAIARFKEIETDENYGPEKKMGEVQRSIDEALNLETPLLEKNLVILSTVASIATMIGLLGTTLGMIRAFRALADSGTVSATQLSIGISEALYNTAGGLIAAVISIVSYNFFTTKVDSFVYMIDEAILNVTHIFTNKIKK